MPYRAAPCRAVPCRMRYLCLAHLQTRDARGHDGLSALCCANEGVDDGVILGHRFKVIQSERIWRWKRKRCGGAISRGAAALLLLVQASDQAFDYVQGSPSYSRHVDPSRGFLTTRQGRH